MEKPSLGTSLTNLRKSKGGGRYLVRKKKYREEVS